MSDALSWPVARRYEWRRARVVMPIGDTYSLNGTAVDVLCPAGPERRRYNPLTRSRLFREFTEHEQGHEGFARFAHNYGLLGFELPELLSFEDGNGQPVIGEPFFLTSVTGCASWSMSHNQLCGIAWRLDAMRNRLVTQPGDVLPPAVGSTLPDGRDVSAFLVSRSALADATSVARRTPWKGRAELLTALARDIQDELNAGLALNVGAPRVAAERIGRQVKFTHDLTPRSLIGAMWLQCLRDVTREEGHSRCLNCKKWISFAGRRGGKSRRPDARFCPGDLCRATWHQNQKRTARLLKEEQHGGTTRTRRR